MNNANFLASLSSSQLIRAAKLRGDIEKKTAELARLLGGSNSQSEVSPSERPKRKLSASHRRKIAAAKAAWWAKKKKA